MRKLKGALPSAAGVAIRGARGTPGHTHVRAWCTSPEPTSVPVRDALYSVSSFVGASADAWGTHVGGRANNRSFTCSLNRD
jgi:hypothetical protein